MPRPPSIWFRKQTGWYMTKIGGVQHKLSQVRLTQLAGIDLAQFVGSE